MLAARVHGIPAIVLAAIGGAWALAVAAETTGQQAQLHHDALLGPGAPPLWAGLLLFVLAWQAMIAAMMLPGSLPLIRFFRVASQNAPRSHAAMAAFLAGYAVVWSGFGVLAFLWDAGVHWVIGEVAVLQAGTWIMGPAVLALAGGFQFTRLKDRCIDVCRNPGAFLLRHYERGAAGAFRLGGRHGLFCLGCCWALMLLMFVVGVANLWWMALLTLVMVYERTRPASRRAVPVTGVALLAAAAVLLPYNAWVAGVLG